MGDVSLLQIVTFILLLAVLVMLLLLLGMARRVIHIDHAVNGVGPDAKAMVANVQDMHNEMFLDAPLLPLVRGIAARLAEDQILERVKKIEERAEERATDRAEDQAANRAADWAADRARKGKDG